MIIAAIVYWNSIYIADAVAHLRANGEIVPDELLADTSPVLRSRVTSSGTASPLPATIPFTLLSLAACLI